MKIKIISDGFPHNTKVVNAETGESIDGVTYIQWTCDARDGIATLVLLLSDIAVEVIGYSEDSNVPR